MSEQLANNAATTLNGSILSGAGTLVVTSAAGFPGTGNFRLLIDTELLLVTAVAGTTYTVTRGIEGTTAAGHANGAAVTQIITAAGLAQFVNDRAGGSGYTPPIDANYTWVNQGGATTTVVGNTVVLNAPASGTKSGRLRVKAAPATPYTITTFFRGIFDPSDYCNFGLVFRESSTGQFHAFQFNHVGGLTFSSDKFTNPTAFSATYRTVNGADLPPGPFWLRIADDGTNRICSFSADGVRWQVFHSIANTDFLTADQVGFYTNSENSQPVSMTLYSWLEA